MALLQELQNLLTHPAIWLGDDLIQEDAVWPTGFDALDEALPGGGWARAGLMEIEVPREGAGELSVCLPALAEITRSKRWVVFVAPPYLPYAPALAQAGLDLSHYMVVRVQTLESRLWSIEQSLRSGTAGAVIFWTQGMEDRHLRRLHLAALEGEAMAIGFSHELKPQGRYNPAPLRLSMRPGVGARVYVDILKRRGGPVPLPLTLTLPRGTPVLSTPLPPGRSSVRAEKPVKVEPRTLPMTEVVHHWPQAAIG